MPPRSASPRSPAPSTRPIRNDCAAWSGVCSTRPTAWRLPRRPTTRPGTGRCAACCCRTRAWSTRAPSPPPAGGSCGRSRRHATVVLLGTNHAAAWLDGVGVWDAGTWRTPLGGSAVDEDLAAAVVGLGDPFGVDRAAHLGEHSIEVQLPFLQALLPEARIVPLAVGTGTGAGPVAAGEALGELLAARRAAGERILLAISSDMAHYPGSSACALVTATLLPHILEVDARTLAWMDRAVVESGIPGLICGMCGIAPAVVGLAALRAMGCGRGVTLARATSADAGGPADRTVGYLAVAF